MRWLQLGGFELFSHQLCSLENWKDYLQHYDNNKKYQNTPDGLKTMDLVHQQSLRRNFFLNSTFAAFQVDSGINECSLI